ncbi:MAG: nucleotidyl transferase AbiEii/AbiGii toxin family protein [Planctomycetota bacterium]
MKDEALQIVAEVPTEQDRLNHLREYLQHAILREMYEIGWLPQLIFHGGTALRILHGLRRFSEDLDFHLDHSESQYEIESEVAELKRRLELGGYEVEYSPPSAGNVRSTFVKFAGGLLHEAGISPHVDQKLQIKLEIDTNPPEGFQGEESLVNEYFPLALTHHDRGSFIAGKCHAILQREWAKGRDLFDLLFYLTRWDDAEPNFVYLNNALQQTGYRGGEVDASNWREKILERVENVDWPSMREDVRPFLLDARDLGTFRKQFLVAALEQ